MWFTLAAIRRPVAMSMFFIAVGLLGLLAYEKLPKQLYPDVAIPIITVSTVYLGASPDDVERLVCQPIEEAVSTINRVKTVTSISREGLGYVVVEFEPNTDDGVAAADVRDKVFGVLRQLPQDAEQPVVQKFDITATPTVIAGMTSTGLRGRELRTMGDRTVKDRVSGATGVAAVTITGGEIREIQVRANQERLAAVGMSLAELRTWLVAQSLDLPGGTLSEGEKGFAVRVLGEFKTVPEIRDLTLTTKNGGLVRLRDVAEVSDASAKLTTMSRLNGNPSVSVTVTKTSDANVIETATAIKDRLKRLESALPGGVTFTAVRDESVFTENSLHDLVTSLVYGVLLATLVVWLFLRNLRATLIIFFAIPTSLLATFFLMRIVGYTMNMMSMLGLALAIGILVDDSIVVLENIYRHLAMGKSPTQAAIDGRAEIGLAAVAITMTDVVVFVPIALMGGTVGKFFRQFGATVAFSTLFSLIVSFTLTPMLASRWLRAADVRGYRDEEHENHGIRWTPYTRALSFCVGRWWNRLLVIAMAAALLWAVGKYVGSRLGGTFFRQADQGDMSIYVELPTEKNLDATDQVMRQIERILDGYEEIAAKSTDVGIMASSVGDNFGQVAVKFRPTASKIDRIIASLQGKTMIRKKPSWLAVRRARQRGMPPPEPELQRIRDIFKVQAELQAKCNQIPGAAVRVRLPEGGRGGGSANPITVQVFGSRDADLVPLAGRVYQRLLQIPGIDAEMGYKSGRPEIQARINRKRATDLGFAAADIATTVRTAVEGDNTLKFRELSNEYDIRIELGGGGADAPAKIPNIIVGMKNGSPIRLRDVADVIVGVGPVELTRYNRQDVINIGVSPPGVGVNRMSTSEAETAIRKALTEVPFPPGTSFDVSGTAQMMRESFGYMADALRISVILVFALLVMLYESWFHPFTIMLGVPMAITGAFLGLWSVHSPIDIFGMIGMIMLMGLVTKNSILLVDFTNTLRARGHSRRDALLRAGPTRMRPIVMTTLTLVLSLSPITTGFGRGAEMRQPLGAAVTGGMLLSTVLTLLVIPAVYCMMDDLQALLYTPIKRLIFRMKREPDDEGDAGTGSEDTAGS